jgi:ribokinase
MLRVQAIPREGESVLGYAYEEPEDGGKGSNQAVAAAKLGAPVALVTLVGNDERGRRALHVFTEHGIDTTFVTEVDGPTDVGFVLLPPSRIPAIATAIERSRGLNRGMVELATPVIESAAIVVSQLEAPQEAAIAAFEIARAAGVRTILNPAPAEPLEPALLEATDILVPNEHEAAALAGMDGDGGRLARELAHALAVPAVIVTAGSAGAFVAAEGSVAHMAAPFCEVVDTTGAGDAFVGALAARLWAGADLHEAAAFAVRAASLSVTRPGTMGAFATADDCATPA